MLLVRHSAYLYSFISWFCHLSTLAYHATLTEFRPSFMIKNNLALLKGSQFMFITRREKYNCFIYCLQYMKILPHWSIQLLSKYLLYRQFCFSALFIRGEFVGVVILKFP